MPSVRGLKVSGGNLRPPLGRLEQKPSKPPAFSEVSRFSPPSQPGELDLKPNLCRTGSSGDAGSYFTNPTRKTAGESLPPRPDPPSAAHARMESASVHLAASEAPPHSHHLIGSGDRPPECRLWIGRPGRRSALFLGARGGRDYAPYVRTLGRLRRSRGRGPGEGGRLCEKLLWC